MTAATQTHSPAMSPVKAPDAYAERPSDKPRMLDLVDRLSTIALTVAGLAAFGSTFLLLTLARGREWLAWVVVCVPASIWLLGLIPRWRRRRAVIQTGAVALLLVAPLLARPSGATGFVALNGVAFATIFPAIIAFRAGTAIVVVLATTALLGATFVLSPPMAVTSGSSVDIVVGVLFCLVLGLGYVLARAQWVGYIAGLDANQEAMLAIEEQDRREREFANARAAVERRIHETALNTLSGISLGVGTSGRAAAVIACQRDLDQLDLGLHDVDDATLAGAIDAAIEVVAFDDLTVQVTVDRSPELPASVALSMRDAVVECLRNVRRHSGTNAATVRATVVAEWIEVTVRDEGVGIAAEAVERFGIRNTLRAGMASIGGSADVASTPGIGTTVTLRAPFPRLLPPPQPPSVTSVLGVSRLGRVGLVAGNVLFLLVAPALSAPLGIEWVVVPLSIVQFLTNIAMALQWDSRWRMPLALVSMATIIAILFATAASHPGCSVWPEVNWTVGILCGSAAALAFAAPATQLGRGLMIAASAVPGLAVVLQLPTSCQVGPFISAVTASAYLVGIWLLLQWGDSTFAATRVRAATQWQRILDARARADRRTIMLAGWDVVQQRGRDLLEAVAEERADPTDPAVRSRATAEAAAIRSRLGLSPGPRTGVERLLARLGAVAEPSGTRIDAEMLTSLSRADLPPQPLCDALEAIVLASAGGLVVLRAAATDGQEDIIVTAGREAVDIAGTRSLPEVVDDCEVLVLDDDEEPALARVVLSRPG